MDPETARLAVLIQLVDIDDLLDSLYNDDDELPEGDARDSFQLMRGDLQKQLQVLEGQVLTLRILKDEHDNRVAFSKLLAEERQAINDHTLAMRLAGLAVNERDQEVSLCEESECGEDTQWDMAKEMYAMAFERDRLRESSVVDRAPLNGIRTAKAGEVKSATKSKILGSKALTKCVVCLEVVSSRHTLTLACEPEPHTYCRKCLIDLFTSSMVNTLLFPPRCCRVPIPLDTCRLTLPKELIKGFDLKVEELATPNPTYCSSPDCSKFIRAQEIKAEVGKCVYCHTKTCVLCKCREHKGLCPSDPHVQLLMDIARRGKWQQCIKCKNMVELAQGCFHMTCRCRNEFCYLCGAKWKTCACPKWDEDYLTRPLPVAPVAPVQPTAPAALIPAPVLAEHRHDWARVLDTPCQDCGNDRLRWVMQCIECDFASCWRCIHNRE
jgi:E3 ubiquitin-protein ligase RNF144